MTEIPSVESLVKEAVAAFQAEYNATPDLRVCAPGRVNIIGEHTDYNDGFVLPMCLPLVTVMVGSKASRSTGTCRVTTLSRDVTERGAEPASVEFVPPRLTDSPLDLAGPKWANYVKGVIAHFRGLCKPFDAVVVSSVPLGGGLSSSASLEVAVYTFLEALHPQLPKVTLRDKALACQEAEHVYAKMPCGIMDQFVSVMGKEHNALLIDCKSLETKLVPLRNPAVVFVITNSNVHHDLATSEYPLRRQQCETAASTLSVASLRDANLDRLHRMKTSMDDVVYRRARHAISESTRVLEAVSALEKANYVLLGELMNSSHNSLRSDYEVSCQELDELVTLARGQEGVYGSRMTGGGFGGCTVTLVKENAVQSLIEAIKAKYSGSPTFYVCSAASGARILQA